MLFFFLDEKETKNQDFIKKIKINYAYGTVLLLTQIKFTVMDKLEFKGDYNELKGKMKQAHGALTDDDVKYEEGKDDEFFGRLQQKLGKTKDEVVAWIRSLG